MHIISHRSQKTNAEASTILEPIISGAPMLCLSPPPRSPLRVEAPGPESRLPSGFLSASGSSTAPGWTPGCSVLSPYFWPVSRHHQGHQGHQVLLSLHLPMHLLFSDCSLDPRSHEYSIATASRATSLLGCSLMMSP